MTFEKFLTSALLFARDTRMWRDMDSSKFYMTAEPCGWQETNAEEASEMRLEWAFHQEPEYIKKYAMQEYTFQLLKDVEHFLYIFCDDGDRRDTVIKFLNEKYTGGRHYRAV